MSVYVFDLGGTLMEYSGMPQSWMNYYPQAFQHVADMLCPDCCAADLEKSVTCLTAFNPRISKKEIEYSPETIFAACLEHWPHSIDLNAAIACFFEGIHLTPSIYPDVLPVLSSLRSQGHKTATLTDLPTAMPDMFFRKDIAVLLPYIDFYVSSETCGFRKPNPVGLQKIADHFQADVKSLIFIGDEEKDKQTALRAGCTFLHIDRETATGTELSLLLSSH